MRWAISALLSLTAAGVPAHGAQVNVHNCAPMRAELQAYEYSDIVKMVPFSTLTLVSRTSGLLGCQGDACHVRIQIGNASTEVPFALDYLCLTTVQQDGVSLIRTDRACTC